MSFCHYLLGPAKTLENQWIVKANPCPFIKTHRPHRLRLFYRLLQGLGNPPNYLHQRCMLRNKCCPRWHKKNAWCGKHLSRTFSSKGSRMSQAEQLHVMMISCLHLNCSKPGKHTLYDLIFSLGYKLNFKVSLILLGHATYYVMYLHA